MASVLVQYATTSKHSPFVRSGYQFRAINSNYFLAIKCFWYLPVTYYQNFVRIIIFLFANQKKILSIV